MKDENKIIVVGIMSLTIIQIVAMLAGVDGWLRAFVAAAIAGLCGWRIPINNEIKVRT